MSSERLEREYQVLRDSNGHVMSNYPINFAGMAALMRNDSANPVTVRVHESTDGVSWDLVLFSTPQAAGLANITMVGLSFAVILFVSNQNYVRISLVADNEDGVFVHLVQWPPKPREPAEAY